MSMLAEKKIKRKPSKLFAPSMNTFIWNSESNIGHKLLESMGWSKGKGIGKNEGHAEPIAPKFQLTTRGLGCKQQEWDLPDSSLVSEPIRLLDEILSEVNKNEGNIIKSNSNESSEIGSLEEKSKNSKARMHYGKFVKGKDLSKISEKDLNAILGIKKPVQQDDKYEKVDSLKTEKQLEECSAQSFEESSDISNLLLINKKSSKEYFTERLKQLKKKRNEGLLADNNLNKTTDSLDLLPDLNFEPQKTNFSFSYSPVKTQTESKKQEENSTTSENSCKVKIKKKEKMKMFTASQNEKFLNKLKKSKSKIIHLGEKRMEDSIPQEFIIKDEKKLCKTKSIKDIQFLEDMPSEINQLQDNRTIKSKKSKKSKKDKISDKFKENIIKLDRNISTKRKYKNDSVHVNNVMDCKSNKQDKDVNLLPDLIENKLEKKVKKTKSENSRETVHSVGEELTYKRMEVTNNNSDINRDVHSQDEICTIKRKKSKNKEYVVTEDLQLEEKEFNMKKNKSKNKYSDTVEDVPSHDERNDMTENLPAQAEKNAKKRKKSKKNESDIAEDVEALERTCKIEKIPSQDEKIGKRKEKLRNKISNGLKDVQSQNFIIECKKSKKNKNDIKQNYNGFSNTTSEKTDIKSDTDKDSFQKKISKKKLSMEKNKNINCVDNEIFQNIDEKNRKLYYLDFSTKSLDFSFSFSNSNEKKTTKALTTNNLDSTVLLNSTGRNNERNTNVNTKNKLDLNAYLESHSNFVLESKESNGFERKGKKKNSSRNENRFKDNTVKNGLESEAVKNSQMNKKNTPNDCDPFSDISCLSVEILPKSKRNSFNKMCTSTPNTVQCLDTEINPKFKESKKRKRQIDFVENGSDIDKNLNVGDDENKCLIKKKKKNGNLNLSNTVSSGQIINILDDFGNNEQIIKKLSIDTSLETNDTIEHGCKRDENENPTQIVQRGREIFEDSIKLQKSNSSSLFHKKKIVEFIDKHESSPIGNNKKVALDSLDHTLDNSEFLNKINSAKALFDNSLSYLEGNKQGLTDKKCLKYIHRAGRELYSIFNLFIDDTCGNIINESINDNQFNNEKYLEKINREKPSSNSKKLQTCNNSEAFDRNLCNFSSVLDNTKDSEISNGVDRGEILNHINRSFPGSNLAYIKGYETNVEES